MMKADSAAGATRGASLEAVVLGAASADISTPAAAAMSYGSQRHYNRILGSPSCVISAGAQSWLRPFGPAVLPCPRPRPLTDTPAFRVNERRAAHPASL